MAPLPTSETSRHSSSLALLRQLLQACKRLLPRTNISSSLSTSSGPHHEGAGQRQMASDKRQAPRIPLSDTKVYVTDGCLVATAFIENISLCGICLSNLPEQLYRKALHLTVFSNENPGIPTLHIQPKWERSSSSGKTMGAAILNTSETLRLFWVHAANRVAL